MNIEDRKKKKKKMYKAIYKTVEKKINKGILTGYKDCYYIFPEYIPGYPVLNRIECLSFIIQRIRRAGHACTYIHPMTLYITMNQKSNKA